jgi:hypothetical protein
MDSGILHSIGDQLVGEYLFDDAILGTAIDTSGMGNSGTVVGSPTVAAGYNEKGAYQFDGGITKYVQKTSFNNLPSSVITVSVWVKINAFTSARIVSHNWLTNGAWIIFLNSSENTVYFGVYNSGQYVGYKKGLLTDQWYNLVGVYDGSKSHIFVNGVEGIQSGVIAIPLLITGDVIIGQSVNGIIDDVRIYSSALSGSEIQKLYAEGKAMHQAAAY